MPRQASKIDSISTTSRAASMTMVRKERACNFCRSATGPLVEGPRVFICGACIDAGIEHASTPGVPNVCSFCRNHQSSALTGENVTICLDCVQFARRILEHQ